ncbi:SLC (SoLute Carrier) [Trichostrongylus colubriformis]|uniref:SLC (SoLute Carrier) n=1 Tax=Trichostrongylus colubriformis TaxID=6319 RepID=A0AAN8F2I8_TRICO
MLVSPSDPSVKKKPTSISVKENQRKNGVSATAVLTNFICGMMGPGCFSVALSFKQAGLWGGFVLTFIIGILSLISMYKLVLCSQHIGKLMNFGVDGKAMDYGSTAAGVLRHSYVCIRPYENQARWIVDACLVAFQLGVLSVSFVFVADHILEVIHFINGKDHSYSKVAVMLLFFVPQLCVNLVNNIRVITFLSACGNFIILLAIALVTKELIIHEKYSHSSLPAVINFSGVTIAAGGLMYAFEGQAMVLALENRLQRASDMVGLTGVLCTSMNVVMLVYAFLGFFGYLTFGPSVAGSLTLNLPNSNLMAAVKLLLVAKIFFGSALQLYVIISILSPPLTARFFKASPRQAAISEYVLRIVLTAFSLTVAVCVPNLYDIIPLVGITAGMLLSLILPSILHTLMFLPIVLSEEKKVMRAVFLIIENTALFVLGWTFLATGLYSSIGSIVSNNH